MDVTIIDLESADPKHIEELATLLVDSFPQSSWTLQGARIEVVESLEPGCVSRVAIDRAGHALGWIGGKPQYGGNVWELHPLVVRANARGMGLGLALVADFEAQVAARGALTIMLGSDDEDDSTSLGSVDVYPNPLAHLSTIRNLRRHPFEFYVKAGFSVVGIVPDANGFGKPDILMAKRVLMQHI